MKCPICNSENVNSEVVPYNSPFNKKNGELITVNVEIQKCNNCQETWLTSQNKKKLDEKIQNELIKETSGFSFDNWQSMYKKNMEGV